MAARGAWAGMPRRVGEADMVAERGKGQAASLVEGLGSETRRRVRWATAEALIEHELRGARSVVSRLGQGQGIAYQMTEEAANACLTSATCDL